jgi:hypothetical protein
MLPLITYLYIGVIKVINNLLSRLQNTRQTSKGEWVALCPAHEDRSPSLGIKLSDDGKILLHCFAGCDVESIAGVVGMELEDLFPPKELRIERSKRNYFNPATVLKCLQYESNVLAIASSDLINGIELSLKDKERILISNSRFLDAVSYCFK